MGTVDDHELRWLYLDLNSFFASVEQQENPQLRGRPVAVVPVITDATCAIAASYEAKAYGIKTGTPIHEARRLCPALVTVLARHDTYVEYHHRVMEELENHLPVTEICSIDEAACRLMENERDPEVIRILARQIKAGLRENIGERITCSIGVAQNRFLAKVASDMKKPDGLTILDSGTLPGALYALNLRDLCGIGANMERRLASKGVHSVQQLMSLAPKQARAIWGSVEGERFWYALHGHDLPARETQKRVVGHSRVLDPALRRQDRAKDVAQALTLKAASRLRRHGFHAGRFYLGARTANGLHWSAEHRFVTPTQENFEVLNAFHLLWATMVQETGGANLKKISVSLYDFYKGEEITGDLFAHAATPLSARSQNPDGSTLRSRPALSQAMDRLNRIYGAGTIRIGIVPETAAGHVGTKIAFTRIPDRQEFRE